MIGFGHRQVSSGNPQAFARPPTQLLLPPAQCARPPNPPVNYLPQPHFVVPTCAAMEPRIPLTYTRPFRPVTYQPFVMPVQHPPPNRYPPPMQQRQQSYPPQSAQFVPPSSVPPPASYQPQQYPKASAYAKSQPQYPNTSNQQYPNTSNQQYHNTSAYAEPDRTNGQTAANWAGWQGEGWEITELRRSLYREFGTLLTVHGPLGERDQPVLGLFMGMPTEARQLIKECGGVKAFLLQSRMFHEDGGKIFLLDNPPPPHMQVVSSTDSGQGSWEGNRVSSRPASGINPNAVEFVPSECSFSEASSDDVFVEGSEETGSTSESAFKEIASAYGIKVTRPEDYSLEDFHSLEDVDLPEEYKDNGEEYKSAEDIVGGGNSEQMEEIVQTATSQNPDTSLQLENYQEQLDSVKGGELLVECVPGESLNVEDELVEEIATSQNPEAGTQLDHQQEQLDFVKDSELVVECVPGESWSVEDGLDTGRKCDTDQKTMASGDTIAKMCKLQELVRSEDLHTDSKSHLYSEAADKDSSNQITSNGAVSLPQTESEANMPESITQEDGLNDEETSITEDGPCSCGATVAFPTFHEGTATVEQSLDRIFQNWEFDKDGNIADPQEHSGESCCQANFNENNNNVDQQSLTAEQLNQKYVADLREYVGALHGVLGTIVENVPQDKLETALKDFASSAPQETLDAVKKELAGYDLQDKLETAMKEVAKSAPLDELETAKDLELSNSALEKEIETTKKEIQQLQEKKTALREEVLEMRKTKYDLQDKLETSRQVRNKFKKLETVKEEIHPCQKEATALREEVLEEQKEIEMRKTELVKYDLQDKLEAAKEETHSCQKEATAPREELEEQEELEEDDLEEEDLVSEMTKTELAKYALQEMLESVKKELAGKYDFQEEFETAVKALGNSVPQEELKTARKEIQQLQENVTALQDELETAKTELKTKESDREQAQLQLADIEKEMTEKLTNIQKELKAAKKDLATQESAREKALLQLEAANQLMTRRIQFTDTLQEKVTSLEEELETAKKEVAKIGLHEELEAAKKELTKNALQFRKDEIHQLQKKVTSLEEELETAKKELETKGSATEQAQLHLDAVEKELTERVTTLQEELDAAKRELESKESATREQSDIQLAAPDLVLNTRLQNELEVKVTALEDQLETAKHELETKESAREQAHLQLEAVNKVLTTRLQHADTLHEKVAALEDELESTKRELGKPCLHEELEAVKKELANSTLQELLETARKEISQLQNKVTALQEELNTAKKELKTKESTHLQQTVVEKGLTEKLQEAETRLQNSLQQEEELKERLQQVETELQKKQDVAEELKKAQERAMQAELQVLNFTFRWCRSELEDQYREGEKMYRFYTERCQLWDRRLEKFCCDWQDYTSDILKQITTLQLLYSSHVQKLQAGGQLSDLPPLSLVRPQMPRLPDLTADMLTSPDSYKLHLVPLLPVVIPSATSSTNPNSPTLPTSNVDWSCLNPHRESQLNVFAPEWKESPSPVATSPKETGRKIQPQQSDQRGSLVPPSNSKNSSMQGSLTSSTSKSCTSTQNSKSSAQDNATSQGKRSPSDNFQVQPLPKAKSAATQNSNSPNQENSTSQGKRSRSPDNYNFQVQPLPKAKSSATQNSNSPTQDNSTPQGKRSPDTDILVHPAPKAKVSEEKQRLRLPSGISKAASVTSGGVPKRRTRTESGSSCSSNVTEASVASQASSSGPPGLVNLQEPMLAHSSPKKSPMASKTSPEPGKTIAGHKDSVQSETSQAGSSGPPGLVNMQEPILAHSSPKKSPTVAKTSTEPSKDSLQQGINQSGSSKNQSNQSASTVQGAAGQPPPGYPNVAGLSQSGSSKNQSIQSASAVQGAVGQPPPPGYPYVVGLGQSVASYFASHPMGAKQPTALPPGFGGSSPFNVPKQVSLGAGLQFMPNINQFSSAHSGVFEFAGHHHMSPNVHPGASNIPKPPASTQPSKELLKTPASFSTKTSSNVDQKTASFTQVVRPKSTISSDKARALAQQALTPDALDTQNKFQALDMGAEDAPEVVEEATPEAKENGGSDETLGRVASPIVQLSNVQEASKLPEVEGSNNTEEEWQLQVSKKKKKVLSAVKESDAPQTSAKMKLLDRLQADLPGYSREQLLAAAAAVRRARHGTLSSLPFCVISSMVQAELVKSHVPSNQTPPGNQAPPGNQLQATPSNQTPPGNQVQTTPGNQVQPTPGNQAQAKPGNRIQATPSNQVQATPDNQIQAAPGNQVQATPGNQAQATPGNQVQATPGDQAAEATPLSIEAQDTACIQAPTEGNLQLARSLLQLKYKTEMCGNFSSRGTCPFGDKCLYAHGLQELRRTPKLTPCPTMQQKGHCPRGDGCLFAHPKNDQRGPSNPPAQARPAPAVRARTSPTARMRLVDLKQKKEQLEDRFDKRRPLWQTLETRQPSQSLDADVCAICVDDLYDLAGSCVRVLDCGHRFHDSCVSRWLLKEERTCPCCRQLTLLPEEFPRLK